MNAIATDTNTKFTPETFVKQYRVSMTAERTDCNPAMPDSDNMDHWRCVLRCGGRRMTLVFSMGYGHNGKAPKVADVLNCLASDASGAEGRDFSDWAGDYGYDTDRKAERTYTAIVKQMRSLGRLLGADGYSDLLWNCERN